MWGFIMNDFTKEELEAILEGLSIIDKDPTIIPEIYWEDNLPEKIMMMISNYCDHPEEYEDFNYCPMRCKKCQEITG
jgi:hypothetical protein